MRFLFIYPIPKPSYTIKARDKGTGLGLPISYGIVKDHNGELIFETEEGSYTIFNLDLPVDNGWELEGEEESLLCYLINS